MVCWLENLVVGEMTVTLWKSSLLAKKMTSKIKYFDALFPELPAAVRSWKVFHVHLDGSPAAHELSRQIPLASPEGAAIGESGPLESSLTGTTPLPLG
jgi:hypothetical protein